MWEEKKPREFVIERDFKPFITEDPQENFVKALLSNNVGFVKSLLKQEGVINPNTPIKFFDSETGITHSLSPIEYAAMRGYLELASLLLEKEVLVPVSNESINLLRWAAEKGHFDILQQLVILIKKQQSSQSDDLPGATEALLAAAANNNAAMMRYLIQEGARLEPSDETVRLLLSTLPRSADHSDLNGRATPSVKPMLFSERKRPVSKLRNPASNTAPSKRRKK